ncbi:MAG: TetR/AcrR family transcriptional regulator [Paludisphaera borealis]|uniref:TetR/AcrR family transcriptional regulator n=1 Tax=Paludisphaera borealis TaxID=1387353 RepID=UPI00283AD304|nr:TetR/AcrR family transcriptional regulator [Paludisphaera borealis]MDR3622560.1 TetR/AcrR family transcriptional regulator [Paludisphaera borealis]
MASSPVNPGASEVARHIARVAARLFAERGYDATSVREIVEAAGVAKPTLYYYFQSKEGLAKALISMPLEGLVERLKLAVETEVDPVRCLEQVLEAHFAFCRDDPDRMRFLYALLFGPKASGMATDTECCKVDLKRWTEAAVRRCAEAGVIPGDRVDACMTMCRGMIVISTVDFLYGDKPLGEDRARVLVADLLRGFDVRRERDGRDDPS